VLKKLLKNLKLNESNVSMVLGAVVILIIGGIVLNYFRGSNNTQNGENVTPTENQDVTPTPKITNNIPEGLPASYTVQKGDSLWKIAEKFYGSGYNWVSIAQENKLKNPGLLFTDQKLTIPKTEVIRPIADKIGTGISTVSGNTYTVVSGDTLWTVAVRAYGDGFAWPKIAQANSLKQPGLIHSGNVLKLPR